MRKINTSPISGMQELTPGLQAQFDRFKAGIMRAFRAHGFQHVETPVIERTEVLLAKAGGDTEKQIYKVVKTAEAAEEANQALRFDHTVPLARYTVKHMNDLAFPFKVTQVARNFRGERAQKGRFREFYQCDVDVVGRGELAIGYDAEVIATLAEAIRALPLPAGFVVRVSNRKLLGGILEELGVERYAEEIFGIVDHAEKVPEEKTVEALRGVGGSRDFSGGAEVSGLSGSRGAEDDFSGDAGLGEAEVARLMEFIRIRGGREEVCAKLASFGFKSAKFREGVAELEEILRLLAELAPETEVVADMMIVRGLDYYTGTVFETVVTGYERQFGSICSGGRYENLAGYYTGQKLPGVGGSIGLTRLFSMLVEAGVVAESGAGGAAEGARAVDVCVIPISAAEVGYAERVAEELRAEGKTVDLVLSEKKLGDKMKYAGRVGRGVVVIGEDEVREKKYVVKELA